MSDARSAQDGPQPPQVPVDSGVNRDVHPKATPKRSRRGTKGMFADPVVRAMSLLAFGLVVMFLLFVISALYFGYLTPEAPRSFVEGEIAESAALVEAGSTTPEIWRNYIELLLQAKQYAKAQSVINTGKGKVDDSWGQEFLWMQAELYAAQGKYDKAIETADEAQAKITEVYETELKSTELPNKAKSWGLSPNHAALSLVKAKVYMLQEQWKPAQEEMQKYVDANPTAAGIMIDLANLKIKNGDKKGARKDLETAQKFLPDDPEIAAGLKAIGAE